MTVTYDLSGRTALVTGGAGAIGRAVAERLRGSGVRVWVFDLARGDGDGIESLEVDLTDADAVKAAVAHVIDQAAQIDILVNAAGLLGRFVPFDRLSSDEVRRIVEVNLVGTLEVCRHVVPHMRRSRTGRIVKMGSLAGKQGLSTPVF